MKTPLKRQAGAQVSLADPRATWLMVRMPEPESIDASTMVGLAGPARSDDTD